MRKLEMAKRLTRALYYQLPSDFDLNKIPDEHIEVRGYMGLSKPELQLKVDNLAIEGGNDE